MSTFKCYGDAKGAQKAGMGNIELPIHQELAGLHYLCLYILNYTKDGELVHLEIQIVS